jgi:hypothetical protein
LAATQVHKDGKAKKKKKTAEEKETGRPF